MRTKYYVGCTNGRRHIFRSATTPTRVSHGALYAGVIGPFRTLRAARLMALFGQNNPHLPSVRDAERIARADAEKLDTCASCGEELLRERAGKFTGGGDA